MATIPRLDAPVGAPQMPDQELGIGELIHFDPRREDGDFFGAGPAAYAEGVGEVSWVRRTEFTQEVNKFIVYERVRRTGFIAVDDHVHLVRETGAAEELVRDVNSAPHTFIFHGCTEAADAGTARRLHDAVAETNPERRTISVATDGWSVHGEALPTREAWNRRFEDMAEARRRIIARLADKAEVEIIGTSMGAALAMLTAYANAQVPERQQANITKLDLINPAILATEVPEGERFEGSPGTQLSRAIKLLRFTGHLVADVPREFAHHPAATLEVALRVLPIIGTVAKEPRKVAAVGGNIRQISKGTPWKVLTAVADADSQVHVLTGSRDTLRQIEQYKALQRRNPKNISLQVLPGRGHALSIVAARETAQTLKEATASS